MIEPAIQGFKAFIISMIAAMFCLFILAMIIKHDNHREEKKCELLGGKLMRLGNENKCLKEEIFNEVFKDLRNKK